MSDQKISELTALTGANVADTDLLPIVDTSATETKKITFGEFKTALDTATGFVRITGDTMTGNLSFGDNVKANFGAGSDLQIYHDGTNSYIRDNAEGVLRIQGAANVQIEGANEENMAVFNQDEGVFLYYDGATKLATTATGIDVTGTVVADGLTVAGTVAFTGGGVQFPIQLSNSFTPNAGRADLLFASNPTSNNAFRIGSIASNAGVTLQGTRQNDSGLKVDLVLQPDGGNVGIGTTTSLSKLTALGTSSTVANGASTRNPVASFRGGNDNNRFEVYVDNSGATAIMGLGAYNSAGGNTDMAFYTGSTVAEAMRIDSSGNVLVGTTDSNPTSSAVNVAGQSFSTTGGVRSTVASNPAATFNRKTDDGDIAIFRKDGTTVGSIGSKVGNLTIGNGDTGLYFAAGADAIYPYNTSTQADRDAAVDLGYSTVRFKDLYLSGGVYLGGTGSANHLDDYEEGTWTPTFTLDAGSATSANMGGYYTKIGNSVTIEFSVGFSATSSATINEITNLPFTVKTSGSSTAVGSIRETSQTGYQWHCRANNGQTSLTVRRYDNDSNLSTNFRLIGSVTYITDS